MITRFNKLELALATHNAGPGAVIKYGGIPPYPETIKYVNNVLETYKLLKRKSIKTGVMMNKREFIENIADTVDISKVTAEKALNGMLATIADTLEKGYKVTQVALVRFW